MSREFAVRLSEELAGRVRLQGASPSRVVAAIASAASQGRLDAEVPDPGAGPERLTVRIPGRALPRLRELTRSRDSLVALRKLFFAGYQAKALPACRQVSLPAYRPAVTSQALVVPARRASASLARPVVSTQFQGALSADKFAQYRREQAAIVEAGRLGLKEPQSVPVDTLDAPAGLLASLWDAFWPYLLVLGVWAAWHYLLKPLWASSPVLPADDAAETVQVAEDDFADWLPKAASSLASEVW